MRKRWWAAIAVGAGLASLFGWEAWKAAWAQSHPEAARVARYERIFDAAWKAVDAHYYDPNFDHARWRTIRDVYRPHVKEAKNDAVLYVNILAKMMSLVGTSHVHISPPPAKLPEAPAQKAAAVRPSPVKLTECGGAYLESYSGFDVATVRRGKHVRMVIADVRKGSAAERAGLAPNDQVREMTLAWRQDGCPHIAMQAITNGQPARDIKFDVEDQPARPPLQRIDLPSGVRMLRFAGFDRITDEWLAENLKTVSSAGLILDLRLNGGGRIWVESRLLSRLLPPGTVVGRQIERHKVADQVTKSIDSTYSGPLAVLIGPGSASAAESTAATLRYHHRALLVGGESAGQVLTSRTFPLPGGGRVQVATADYLTPDGHRLEGVGVKPDIPVAQTLAAIRAGRDLPLEAAERALLEGRRP